MIKSFTQFLKNIGFNMIADFANRIGNYVLVIFISQNLGVTNSGMYSTAHNYLNIGLLISYWGFSNLITREISHDPDSYSRYFSNALIMRIILSILGASAIIGLVNILGYDQSFTKLVAIITLSILSGSINHLIHATFQAFEKIKFLSIVSILISLTKIFVGYILVRLGKNLYPIAWLIVVLDWITTFAYFYLLKKHLPKLSMGFNPRFGFKLLKLSLPFFAITLVTLLDSRTEIIIVSQVLGDTAVGLLNPVNAVMGLLYLFPEGIRYSALPLLVKSESLERDKFQKLIQSLSQLTVSITVPLSIIFLYYADVIVSLIFPEEFYYSIDLLKIIIWSYVLYGLNVIASRLLITFNREKILTFSILISAVLAITINLLSISSYGLIAIAFVRIITALILLIFCVIIIQKIGYSLISLNFIFKIVIIGTIMYIILVLTDNFHPLISIAISLLAFIIGYFCLGIVSKTDSLIIRNIARDIFESYKK